MAKEPLFAEGLGTALLLMTIVGSGIMAERLAGGNAAVALLGNTLPTGAMLAVLILIFGPVSGAHFNPAISMCFATRGEIAGVRLRPMPPFDGRRHCGVWIAHLMFDLEVLQFSATHEPAPANGLRRPSPLSASY